MLTSQTSLVNHQGHQMQTSTQSHGKSQYIFMFKRKKKPSFLFLCSLATLNTYNLMDETMNSEEFNSELIGDKPVGFFQNALEQFNLVLLKNNSIEW